MIYSDTEFYYASPDLISNTQISLNQEESKHLSQVMRHSVGDKVFVTDGIGNIYSTIINAISKKSAVLDIINNEKVKVRFPNITLFIPILKSSDRFEFALEKSIELGITKFAIYSAEKSHKRGVKLDRWNKIALAAMKQSLQSYKPIISYFDNLGEIDYHDSINYIFDQLAEVKYSEKVKNLDFDKKVNLLFGPEAGLTEKDKSLVTNPQFLNLTKNRLRAETAIISAISVLSTNNQ